MSSPASKGLTYFEPQEFSARHKQVVALKAAGNTNKEIAKLVGYTPARVSTILNDPRGQYLLDKLTAQFIRELSQDTREVIQSHALEMAEAIVELARHADSEQVRYRAASDMLDRAGYKAKDVMVQANVEISKSDVVELGRRLEESFEKPRELEFVEDSSGIFRQAEEEGGGGLEAGNEERLEELEEALREMGVSK